MSDAEKEIPQRELRNNVAAVLREVAAGAHIRITVRGKPVADLVPIRDRSTFVERSAVETIIERSPLDPGFAEDVDAALGATVEEL